MLLIDIGNTRIKWARVTRGRLTAQRSTSSSDADRAAFTRLIDGGPVAAVCAVNVAGPVVERALRAAVRAAGLPPPRLLASEARTRSLDGFLTNGYREPWRLGADRWAALLGARALTRGHVALCVIDIGTALTADFVEADGRHRGGYIVPGPQLAVGSLLSGTQGIQRRAASGAARTNGPWPRSTLPAIERGALVASAGMVERVAREARSALGSRPHVLLTGGAAASVMPLLQIAVLHQPDLVLQGLRVWADAGC